MSNRSVEKREACCTLPVGGFKREESVDTAWSWRDKKWHAPGSDWHRV